LTPQGQFELERKEETRRIDEEKEQRLKSQSEKRKLDEQDEEEMKKLRR